ncbi:MAG: MBL fold metallo-hydrolase [Lentisphaerae bacterium]|nr:MAG: MBL fold metallo-hydrolase [Lentisphaerota bacterium]
MAVTHDQLVQDVIQAREEGLDALWWLGQHSFILTAAGKVILIDPYLSENPRRTQGPLLTFEEAAQLADVICGTHDHSDHIDHPFWRYLASQDKHTIRYILPARVMDEVAEDTGLSREQMTGMNGEEDSIRVDDLQITAIPAAHELLDEEEGRHRFLGFVISHGSVRVYHAGDTCIYEGIQARLRSLRPSVMLLPINGRDAERLARGCIGNMTYQEAVDLAGSIQPQLVIPTHFDMFPGNQENPELFMAYLHVKYPSIKAQIPRYGERIPLA